jgi:hypothetical protein
MGRLIDRNLGGELGRGQLPRGVVCWPARDIGWPYLARFDGVSGTGPLVTVWLV